MAADVRDACGCRMAADEERWWRMRVDAKREGDGVEIWSMRSCGCLKRNGGHGVEKMVAAVDKNECRERRGWRVWGGKWTPWTIFSSF
jgi:hypothetical protein